MKKIVFPAVAVGALLLTACGSGESSAPAEAVTPQAATEQELDDAAVACVEALRVKFNQSSSPLIEDYRSHGSSDSVETVGVLIITPGPDRYRFKCVSTREGDAFTSEVIRAIAIPNETTTTPTSTTRTQPPASTATRTPIPQTSTPLSPRCKTPSESTIAAINASFKEDGYYLADVYMVYGAKDVAYIGANIMAADGHRASSADIWADKGGLLFSLSGDARRRTSLPDGRHLLDISAGDEYGQEVAECIQTAVINRNSTGGR